MNIIDSKTNFPHFCDLCNRYINEVKKYCTYCERYRYHRTHKCVDCDYKISEYVFDKFKRCYPCSEKKFKKDWKKYMFVDETNYTFNDN